MEQHWFNVVMEYENRRQRQVTYQFEDNDDFLKQMRKFKRCVVPKELIQEVFNEYIHNVDYILTKVKKKPKRKKKEKKIPLHGRGSIEYNEWRIKVLTRDNYTCQKCGSKENIEVHHIHKYMYDPNNTDIGNGISLCKDCHDIANKEQNMRKEGKE